MKIEAVKLNQLLSKGSDLYRTVILLSKRARQIIGLRFDDQIDMEDIEDSEDLKQLSKEDFDIEKPIVQAYNELLNDELECKIVEDVDIENE